MSQVLRRLGRTVVPLPRFAMSTVGSAARQARIGLADFNADQLGVPDLRPRPRHHADARRPGVRAGVHHRAGSGGVRHSPASARPCRTRSSPPRSCSPGPGRARWLTRRSSRWAPGAARDAAAGGTTPPPRRGRSRVGRRAPRRRTPPATRPPSRRAARGRGCRVRASSVDDGADVVAPPVAGRRRAPRDAEESTSTPAAAAGSASRAGDDRPSRPAVRTRSSRPLARAGPRRCSATTPSAGSPSCSPSCVDA